MAFAPIWIPLKRRVQTLAVMIGVWLAFLSHANCVIVWLLLFFTPLWPIPIIYATLVYIFDNDTSSKGGRRIHFVRKLSIWNHFCDYFPIKLIKTAHLDKKHNYIFGFHPHGIISAGAFGNFATEGSKFSEIFPGIKPHLLTLKGKIKYSPVSLYWADIFCLKLNMIYYYMIYMYIIIILYYIDLSQNTFFITLVMFKFPFLREIMLAFGLCDVSKESIQRICENKDGGNAAIIIVGGAAESLDARPGSCTVTLKDRKGFIRMAFKTGLEVIFKTVIK